MLRPNPELPPRPSPTTPACPAAAVGVRRPAGTESPGWWSAEDFDATGILAGIDPCESRYWWIAELHHEPVAVEADATCLLTATEARGRQGRPEGQATARRSPPTAAA